MTRRTALAAYLLGQMLISGLMVATLLGVHDGIEATAYVTAGALVSIALTGIYAATGALHPPGYELEPGDRYVVGHYDGDGALVIDRYLGHDQTPDVVDKTITGIPANGYPPTLRRPAPRRGRHA